MQDESDADVTADIAQCYYDNLGARFALSLDSVSNR